MALTSGVFFDPLILTEAQLLSYYNKALSLVLEGKTLMSWSGEGVQSSKAFSMPVEQVLREVRLALKAKNPQKYGYITNRSRVFFA
jgi:hypothetical protein